jgi:hypothetical protein
MFNKSFLFREIREAMATPAAERSETRFRQLSTIFGAKSDRTIKTYEAYINEAALQISLQQPAYLTRREDLLRLAKHVIQQAGFQGVLRSGQSLPLSIRFDSKTFIIVMVVLEAPQHPSPLLHMPEVKHQALNQPRKYPPLRNQNASVSLPQLNLLLLQLLHQVNTLPFSNFCN